MINNEAPDDSDDVYAAAIIAYELLSGKHPYERKTADKALALGLKPAARIRGLSNRSWRALEAALKIKRADRTSSIGDFYRGLTQKKKFPVFKWVSAMLVLAVTSLAYVYFSEQTAFDDIVEQTMAKSQVCMEAADYRCAVESLKALIEMVPEHPTAIDMLTTAEIQLAAQQVNRAYTDGESCLDNDKDIICAQAKLRELKGYEGGNDKAQALAEKITYFENNRRVRAELDKAEACLSRGDFACVLAASNAVLKGDKYHALAGSLRQTAQAELEKISKKQAALSAQYNSHLKQARDCLEAGNYACAIEKSALALSIRPADSQAESVKQKSQLLQFQQQANLEKSEKLLEKAQTCYARKNYTCAISNAESAMEFVDNYPPAVSLRKQAVEEQEEIKKSFSIQ